MFGRIEVAQKRAESFSFDRLNMISNYCVLLGGCLIATATLFVQTNLVYAYVFFISFLN